MEDQLLKFVSVSFLALNQRRFSCFWPLNNTKTENHLRLSEAPVSRDRQINEPCTMFRLGPSSVSINSFFGTS